MIRTRLMYFGFAFINFFFFKSPGLYAMGALFLVLGLMTFVKKPKSEAESLTPLPQKQVATTSSGGFNRQP